MKKCCFLHAWLTIHGSFFNAAICLQWCTHMYTHLYAHTNHEVYSNKNFLQIHTILHMMICAIKFSLEKRIQVSPKLPKLKETINFTLWNIFRQGKTITVSISTNSILCKAGRMIKIISGLILLAECWCDVSYLLEVLILVGLVYIQISISLCE